jgi:hypothetical protein
MKAAVLVFLITSCAVVINGRCIAEPPSNAASRDISLRMNKGGNDRTLHVHPLTIASSNKSLENSRSRSPAIIGGPANRSRNAAAINGTGMKRNP